mgnify:CR=1 FL=1
MAEAIFLLTCWHLLLFRHFYFINPYRYATSELLEQVFPSWLHLGRSLRHGRLVVEDPYYYPDYPALPFLSSFYPPHMVSAWLATFLPLNQAFLLLVFTMVSHFLAASVSVYILAISMGTAPLVAGFASVTLSSLGYSMKQNSSIIYTTAWVPTLLLSAQVHSTLIFGISFGMMLLAGYWPIALYAIPLGCLCWLLG